MSNVLLGVLGGLIGLVIIFAALWWAIRAEPKSGRSWLAPPSGRNHEDSGPLGTG